jgi:thiol-disulfide isomerase/thioredoxin
MTKLSKSMGMGMGVGISRSIKRVGRGIGLGFGTDKGVGSSNSTLFVIVIISVIGAFAILILNKELIKETFFSGTSGAKRYTLEYYYAESCGYCVKFNKEGIWDELSEMTFNNVDLKKYNSDDNADRFSVMKISSFPTFIMVDNSVSNTKAIDSFEEERSKENLLEFINKYENKKD